MAQIGSVWAPTSFAVPAWAADTWADVVVELLPGGGNAPRTRERRGGLLHEERYFAALEDAAVQHVAAEINQSHPIGKLVQPPATYQQEDEELILLYKMASLYGA